MKKQTEDKELRHYFFRAELNKSYHHRMQDLRKLWEAYNTEGIDTEVEDKGGKKK